MKIDVKGFNSKKYYLNNYLSFGLSLLISYTVNIFCGSWTEATGVSSLSSINTYLFIYLFTYLFKGSSI